MIRKLFCILCAYCCLAAPACARQLYRVMTCNIRVALPQDADTGNGWATRRDVCFKVMKDHAADVYCLQEVVGSQYKDLCESFPDYFVFGYEGPEMDNMPDTLYHGIAKNVIMFVRKRFRLVGAGTYWLAENPLCGGQLSWGTARARHVNWVRLEDRHTGRQFRVCSLHLDHVSQEARERQIEVFLEEAAQYPDTMPQILCGDFNARPDNPIIALRLPAHGWADVYRLLNGHYESFSAHRFLGRDYHPKKTPAQIDYIFTQGTGVRAAEARFIKDDVGGKYPSDHFFLLATIEVE